MKEAINKMEWWQTTIVVVGGFLTIFNLVDKIINWIKEAKKPQTDLEARITKLEKVVEGEYRLIFASYEERFKRDLERINDMEKSNKLIIKSLLALMRHAETGNNVAKLKETSEELQNYIVDTMGK